MKYITVHDKIVDLCKTATTFTEVETKLGISTPSTGLRRYIKQNKIPMPLYEGRKASAAKSQKNRDNIADIDLCENSTVSTGGMKKYLLRAGIKTPKCEKCGWAESRKSDGIIPIHLHHINGDASDNRLENLQILCPNCHSLTENYSGKNKCNNRRRKEFVNRQLYYYSPRHTCQQCGLLGYGEKFCSVKCSAEATRKTEWPTIEQLAQEIATLNWTAIGRKYGVSDNAVRKWAKHYGLLS